MKHFLALLFSAALVFAQAPAPADAPTNGEPSTLLAAGVGAEGLGPTQVFGWAAVSHHVAAKSYLGTSYEAVRMPGGLIGTSAHAEFTNVLYKLGRVWLGVTGGVGLAEGANGSASGSFSGAGFGSCRCFGPLPLSFVITFQVVTIAGTGDKPRPRFGFVWAF
jgi:hypothetical protein